jgi:hypothetical protein
MFRKETPRFDDANFIRGLPARENPASVGGVLIAGLELAS